MTVLGVGLLGGSIGLSLRRLARPPVVMGWVRRAESIPCCAMSGTVDHVTLDMAEAVHESNIIVLGTPVGSLEDVLSKALKHAPKGVIVTDVGSVKGPVNHRLEELCIQAGARWVGSHPMAGGEQSGVAAARSNLFEGAICIVTPTSRTDPEALRTVEELWRAVGGRLLCLSPDVHDEVVAWSSHLPHMVASVLADTVLDPQLHSSVPIVAAGGFRDTTRVASGSPEMWRDIALSNAPAIRAALKTFMNHLAELDSHLEQRNSAALESHFVRARDRRNHWAANRTQSDLPQ